MINLNQMFDEFNATYRIKEPGNTSKLIKDELLEMLAEIPTSPEHAKECADTIYISLQQLRAKGVDVNEAVANPPTLSYVNFDIIAKLITDNTALNDNKNIIALVAATISYMKILGYKWQLILEEVHRSNMSKTVPYAQVEEELKAVRERYPNAYIVEGQQDCILKCADTNKVIKPSCYSKAVIKPEWI